MARRGQRDPIGRLTVSMAIGRSTLRALSGRYLVAFGVAGVLMIGSVLTVNYVIDAKLSNVKRVSVKTAPSPPQGANYLLLGSDTRAFVKNQQQRLVPHEAACKREFLPLAER